MQAVNPAWYQPLEIHVQHSSDWERGKQYSEPVDSAAMLMCLKRNMLIVIES